MHSLSLPANEMEHTLIGCCFFLLVMNRSVGSLLLAVDGAVTAAWIVFIWLSPIGCDCKLVRSIL